MSNSNVKICILSSCTDKKLYCPPNQLTRDDFQWIHDRRFIQEEAKLEAFRTPASKLYRGDQHKRLLQGIEEYKRNNPAHTIDLWILSAGYGLIPGKREIVPYHCTFRGMKPHEISSWSRFLNIPQTIRQLFTSRYDLLIVLLGEDYLRALELGIDTRFCSPVIFLASQSSSKHIHASGNFRVLELSINDTTRFACGMVGLKGEVGKRLFAFLNKTGMKGITSLFDPKIAVLDILVDATD